MRSTSILIFFFLLKQTFCFSQVKFTSNDFIGTWKIIDFTYGGEKYQPKNEYIEIHRSGIFLGRNKKNNTTNNVGLFEWNFKNDTFNISGADFIPKFHNDTLLLNLTISNSHLKSLGNTPQPKSQIYLLKKVNTNPLKNYNQSLNGLSFTGNWSMKSIYFNGLLYNEDITYDIQARNDTSGQLIYYKTSLANSLDYDSIYLNEYKIFSDDTLNNKTCQFFSMNDNHVIDAYQFYSADGIMLLKSEVGNTVMCFTRNSSTVAHNIEQLKSSMKNWYARNSNTGNQTSTSNVEKFLGDALKLIMFLNDNSSSNDQRSTHYIECPTCHGSYWGSIDCKDCHGKRGYYVYDDNGERVY